MVSILIIGIGTGGSKQFFDEFALHPLPIPASFLVKANVSPLVAEQYTKHGQWIKTKKNGQRVIVDANLTIRGLYAYALLCEV